MDNASAEPGIIRKRAQQIASKFVAAIGVVISVVTLILMLTSVGFRNWVKLHQYWMLSGLIAAIVVIFVLLNILLDMSTELRRLRRSEDLRHIDQDKRASKAVLTRIPPDGALIAWLRTSFNPSLIPGERLSAVKEAHRYLGSDISRFGDPAAAVRYLELKNTAGTLLEILETRTSMEAGNVDRIIPVEWEYGPKRGQAVAEIQDARESFIRAYDAFVRTCHERGIWPG